MGQDDDEDCAHDWQLEQVLAGAVGARLVHRCRLCDGLDYEASRVDRAPGTGAGT